MASSTTIPSTMIKPNRLMTLAVMPNQGMKMSPPAKPTGMPITIQNASPGRRNRPSTINTNTLPCSKLLSNVLSRPRIDWDSSSQTYSSMPSGNICREFSTYSCTLSEMAIALSVPVLRTSMNKAGLPLNSTRFSPSSKPSMTFAISPTSSSEPFADRIGMFANSSAE